jgi:hypothetical protein
MPASARRVLSNVLSCPYCPTDIKVNMWRENEKCRFATVALVSYRDLGPRGPHTDEIWKRQNETYLRSSDSSDRSMRGYPFGAESLADVWDRGQG